MSGAFDVRRFYACKSYASNSTHIDVPSAVGHTSDLQCKFVPRNPVTLITLVGYGRSLVYARKC